MAKHWRISSLSGVLLAAYFIPAWTLIAFKIMVSPIHGLYDRPNISMALFVSDHLHLAGAATPWWHCDGGTAAQKLALYKPF